MSAPGGPADDATPVPPREPTSPASDRVPEEGRAPSAPATPAVTTPPGAPTSGAPSHHRPPASAAAFFARPAAPVAPGADAGAAASPPGTAPGVGTAPAPTSAPAPPHAHPAGAPEPTPSALFAAPSAYRRAPAATPPASAPGPGAPTGAPAHAGAAPGGGWPGAPVRGHVDGATSGVPSAPGTMPGHGAAPPGVLPAGTSVLGPADPAHPHPPAPVRRRPRRVLSVAWVVPLLVLSLLAGYAGGLLGARTQAADPRRPDADLPVVAAPGERPDRAPESVAGIAAGVLPSVVSIEVTTDEGAGSGSGFVLREDGYVLTNNHVVAGAATGDATLVVMFADGTELPGTVVGATGEYDLAVVKVEATGLTPLVLGDSDAVVVGDPVVAIGAPLGLVGTVTTGIVSALNRPVVAGEADDTAFINAIQTDAAINPGNSGGPLVNGDGQVVGINSAIAQLPGRLTSAGSIGLGFAIPSNQARRTAEQLIETGSATYPVIGVLLDPEYSGEGVRVFEQDPADRPAVTPDGPADVAGIRNGDVILSIDGRPVTASEELIVAIRARQPGDTVVLRVRTGDDERDVRVRLDELASG